MSVRFRNSDLRLLQTATPYAAMIVFICLWTTALRAQDDSAEARRACTPDVFKLCSQFIPDADQITACLKQQRQNLSAGCKKVMAGRSASR